MRLDPPPRARPRRPAPPRTPPRVRRRTFGRDLAPAVRRLARSVRSSAFTVALAVAAGVLAASFSGGDAEPDRAGLSATVPPAPEAPTGLAAATPRGAHAFSIPVDARTPPVRPGQHVEVFTRPPAATSSPFDPTATTAPGHADLGSGGRSVTADAVVVQIDDRQLTIAVTDADRAAVAGALLDGDLIVAVNGAE